MTDTPSSPTQEERDRVAQAIMETRIRWGWTFGKRKRVMAIDLLMAEAAIAAMSPRTQHQGGSND